MKIVIDISQLHPAALKRGVGLYALSLFEALKALKDENKYFLRKTRKEKYEADLVHYPYFDPFFLTLPLTNKPFIATIHDLTPIKFPQHFPCGLRGKIKWQIQKYLLKKVAAIITDSENSKRDIIEIIGYPENKIFPIHLAAGKEFGKIGKLEIGNWKLEICKKYSLPEYFLLYVGDLNWNKNVKGLIRAISAISYQLSAISLVLVGSAFENKQLEQLKQLKQLIAQLELDEKVKLLGFVPTEDLVKIYNLAALYIQPSFYEGFGLPVLEAMSCGCPVLCSSQASLPEVGGRGVEYFNPYKKGDLEEKLILLFKNKNKLKDLSNRGLKRSKMFSWKKTALETAKVYRLISKSVPA